MTGSWFPLYGRKRVRQLWQGPLRRWAPSCKVWGLLLIEGNVLRCDLGLVLAALLALDRGGMSEAALDLAQAPVSYPGRGRIGFP
jgi:hypothetical protein